MKFAYRLARLRLRPLVAAVSLSICLSAPSQAKISGYITPEVKWPGNPAVVRVCFDFKGYAAEKDEVKRGASRWGVYTNLSFTWLDLDNSSDAASCAQGDVVRIRLLDVADEAPYTMDIGTDNRKDRLPSGQAAMYLNFTFQNFQPSFEGKRYRYHPDHRMSWIRHYALHEFGHILGLSHEHNRKDKHASTEKYGKLVASCRDDHASGQTPLTEPLDQGTKTVGFFDPYSIMNYPCTHADDSRPIPQLELSCGDKATIREMYGIRNAGVDRECVTACLAYARMDANLAKRSSDTPEYAKCVDELRLSGSEPPRPEELTYNDYKIPAGGSISVDAPYTGSEFKVGPTSYTKAAPDARIRVSVADKEKDGMPGYDVTFTLENALDFRNDPNSRYIPSISYLTLYESAWRGPEGQAGNGERQYFTESNRQVVARPLFYGGATYTRWVPKGDPKYFQDASKFFVQKSSTPPATNSLFVQDLKTGEFLIDRSYHKLKVEWCEYAKKTSGDILSPMCTMGDLMRAEIFLRGIPSFLSRRDAAGNHPPGPATGGTAANQPPSGHFAKTRVSWQPSADTDPVNYTVYVSTTANPMEGKAYFAGRNTYLDLTLGYGTRYYWSVLAYDGTYVKTGDTWSFETAAAPFTLLCPPDVSQPLFAPHYGSHTPGNGDMVYSLQSRATNGLQLIRPGTVPATQWRPIDYPDGTCVETKDDEIEIVLASIPPEVTRDHYLVVVANEERFNFTLWHESAAGPRSINPGISISNPLVSNYGMFNIVYLGDYWGNPRYPEWRPQDRLLSLRLTTRCACAGAPTSVKISKIFFTRNNPFLFDFRGFAGTGPQHEESPGVHIPLARVAPDAKLTVPLHLASGLRRHTLSLDPVSSAKGMSIDTKNNLLNWTPGAAHLGRHVATVTVRNSDNYPSLSVSHKLAVEVARLPSVRKNGISPILPFLLD